MYYWVKVVLEMGVYPYKCVCILEPSKKQKLLVYLWHTPKNFEKHKKKLILGELLHFFLNVENVIEVRGLIGNDYDYFYKILRFY